VLNKISERRINPIRAVLTTGWLVLIITLFYNPLSIWLTSADNLSSPFHIHPDICIPFRETCIQQHSYNLGNSIFWSGIIPLVILVLLIFGHEAWRRICPLSFLSQLPRRLGWQRSRYQLNLKTGKILREVPKISQDSWLGRNQAGVQFGLLYFGLCCRLLFLNGNAIALAIWLLATIASAMIVGTLYDGKPWCHYICPMAPVQRVFSEPRGILTSRAHLKEPGVVTQSMCRIPDPSGRDKSACVGCQKLCMDIDAEKGYWETITQPSQRILYYGYFGLVAGFFGYYYLYAGNWDYYFSGVWAQQGGAFQQLLEPGFYFAPIPKLIAVPLVLAFSCLCSYGIGIVTERLYKRFLQLKQSALSQEEILHRLYSVWTIAAFNLFFAYAGRPLINRLPFALEHAFTLLILAVSFIWIYQIESRSPERYSKEKIVARLRRQLKQFNIPMPKGNLSLRQISPEQIHALAKHLPDYQPDQTLQVYEALLREALEDTENTLTHRLLMTQLALYQRSATVLLVGQMNLADVSDVDLENEKSAIVREHQSAKSL
jgi:hypothetical protein